MIVPLNSVDLARDNCAFDVDANRDVGRLAQRGSQCFACRCCRSRRKCSRWWPHLVNQRVRNIPPRRARPFRRRSACMRRLRQSSMSYRIMKPADARPQRAWRRPTTFCSSSPRVAASSIYSARSLFSFAFSSSKALSRFASETSMPPNSAFQLSIVASEIPCLQARSARPRAGSCSFKTATICSFLNLARFIYLSFFGPGSNAFWRK